MPASETAIDERLHLIGQLPLQARAAAFAELHDDLRDQLEQSDATQPRD